MNGVRVRRFRCLAPNDSYYFSPSLNSAVRATNADILHIHGYYDITPLMTILMGKKNKKCLFTLHSSGSSSEIRKILHAPYNLAMRNVMKKVDRVICVSRFEFEYFRRLLNLSPNQLEMIPNGANPRAGEKKGNTKAKPPILLSAGRLEKYKGVHRVLRAFKTFKELYPEDEIRLCILGTGPYESQLKNETEKLEISKFVRFLGWLSSEDYRSMLEASSIFITLSDYESQSIVVCEALNAGTPVIASDNTCLSEYIQDGYALGVKNPNDSCEVAEKIKLLLSDPKLCRVSDYSIPTWDKVTEATFRIYQELLYQ